MIKSLLLSIFILFSATVIEFSVLSNISFLIVVPDLVLICSIYFSLLNGRTLGVTTGFISGLFIDFASGFPLGFNCLFRTLIGYIYGFFSKNLIISGILIPAVTVAIGTLSKNLLTSFINLVYPNINLNITLIVSKEFLFELVANILLAPVIFKFLSVFRNTLSIKTIQDRLNNV